MRGIASTIIIGFIAAISILTIWAVIFNVFLGERIARTEVAKEIEFIEAVNRVEMVKRGLPYSLYYSFKEAMKRNNYGSVRDIADKAGFERQVSSIFSEYRKESNDTIGVTIPDGDVSITILGDEATLSFTSSGFLTYNSTWFKIQDNPNVTIKIIGDSLVE